MWDNPASSPMPIRIYADRAEESAPEDLSDHMTWRAALANDVRGLVLPLELAIRPHFRQDLRGLDVLEWTRFAGERFRDLPVLAVAWQDLESILRHRLSPVREEGQGREHRSPKRRAKSCDPKGLRARTPRLDQRKSESALDCSQGCPTCTFIMPLFLGPA